MPATRSTDPDTSRDAAASVTNIGATQSVILDILFNQANTHHGIRQQYERMRGVFGDLPQVSDSGLRTRTRELVDAGLVEDSGFRVELPTGRRAIAWQLTPAGRDLWWRLP